MDPGIDSEEALFQVLILLPFIILGWSAFADSGSHQVKPQSYAEFHPSPVDTFRETGRFSSAAALCVDPLGFIYVLDRGSNELICLSRDRKVVFHTGGYGWSQFAFDDPHDLDAPNGLDVYVADYGNHRVQRFDRNLTLVSSLPPVDEVTGSRSFGYPRSVALAASGALYLTDGENNRIARIDGDGSIRTFGGIDAAKGRLRYPTRIRVNSNELVFVQDSNAIVMFDRFGNFVRRIGNYVFQHLSVFAIDEDTIYALDGCRLLKINERGFVEDTLADLCSPEGEMAVRPVDIAVRHGICYLLTEHSVQTLLLTSLYRKND